MILLLCGVFSRRSRRRCLSSLMKQRLEQNSLRNCTALALPSKLSSPLGGVYKTKTEEPKTKTWISTHLKAVKRCWNALFGAKTIKSIGSSFCRNAPPQTTKRRPSLKAFYFHWDFCHRKKVIPFELIVSHKERWMYPVNGDWSNCRSSHQKTVRYYHAAKKCATNRFTYFSVDYIEIPNDIKDRPVFSK